ncbi:helix-turn-helix domain-containing protein [Fuchsiella alkaliacetigena]|uniref:helix-turn-helix domain-containing protein n=1 Tax=Fuchsiella alkaliacetigena TaxID=957042 RepID=UPI00200B83C1|nr:helix-turn-helix transcriptional regulator [Fuchsiella alkaliacetigena]MCK8825491.1 helix-turn-helix domain-containing protein [Fuchsiella alkaliacetigena]
MFGERLRKLRKEVNLNQEEVADDLDISSSSLGGYEREERWPTNKELLVKIADYYGVSVDYLLGRTDFHKVIKSKDDQNIKIMKKIQKLKESHKEIIIDFIDVLIQKNKD